MICFTNLSAMIAIATGLSIPVASAERASSAKVEVEAQDVQQVSTSFSIQFSESPGMIILSMIQGEERGRLRFVPQGETQLTAVCEFRDSADWKEVGRAVYRFWPQESDKVALGVLGDKEPSSWKGQTLHGMITQTGKRVEIRFLGRGLYHGQLADAGVLQLESKGAGEVSVNQLPFKEASLFSSVELNHLVKNNSSIREIKKTNVGGIPFLLIDEGKTRLSLREAGWSEERIDPSSFFENYDIGPAYSGDPRLLQVQVPRYDYSGAWILARFTGEREHTNVLTLRLGSRGEGGPLHRQFLLADYTADIPQREGEQAEGLHLVYVPFPFALAQDIESQWMDLELTKEIRLARRSPDPNRYRWRPVGLPSGVEIAGITLVKSPLQLEISPVASGALFVSPSKPAYIVKIRSLSEKASSFKISYRVKGERFEGSLEGEVPAHGEWRKEVTITGLKVGHYAVEFTLTSGGDSLLKRDSMMALLPPDKREHRESALLGTWDFGGNHFTSADPNFVGSVMKKLGLRYGMFRASAEDRAKYGVVKGDEAKIDMRGTDPTKAAENYSEKKKEHPDLLPSFLLFHEDAISAEHANRPPDLFSGRPPYEMTDRERERFQKMVQTATQAAQSMREGHPEVKLSLGNGGITLREEMYRAGYPRALFDSAGNESMSGANPPESQPPNSVSINSGLWMDRQLLDAYGYPEKPVTMCYEVIYPSTTPGNLSYETQANYLIRHLLHAMAWKPGIIRPGGITDKGNSYYHSNWGASGLLTARPRFEPKPSAVALATLSQMLDGATYQRFLETGSDSAYLLEFQKSDHSLVYAYWGVRGERKMRIEVKGASKISMTDWRGRTEELSGTNGIFEVTLSGTPGWLSVPKGSVIQKLMLEETSFPELDGKQIVLDPLTDLSQWSIDSGKDSLLENYNPLTPRRRGKLFIEKGMNAQRIRIDPEEDAPATVPMYAALRHAEGILLPEGAVELALQVRGNSGWGRIIYELKDAAGQIWTSVGARAEGGSDWLADAIGREGADNYRPGEIADWNTDDVFGVSRINFDGWGWISIPLPGNYPGGYPWPANSQWRTSGKNVVHLPLTLHRIIIEQPEKVLYVKDYRAPKRDEIEIRRLTAIEREFDGKKSTPFSYEPSYQVNIP